MNDRKELVRSLLFAPLFEKKWALISALLAAALLSISQGALVFIAGPLLKALVGMGSDQNLSLSSLLHSAKWGEHIDWDLSITSNSLSLIIPISLIAVGLIRAVSLYIMQISQESISLWVTHNYRCRLFEKVIHRPYLAIVARPSSEWMSMVMNDVLFLQQRFSEILKSVFRDVFIILGSLLALLIINLEATLILILASIPFGLTLGFASRNISKMISQAQSMMAQLANQILGVRRRFVHLRSQGGEKVEIQFFDDFADKYFRHIRSSIKYRATFPPLLEWLGFVCLAGFFAYYTKDSKGSMFDGEYVFQFLVGVGFLIRPLRNFGEQFTKLNETMGALKQSLSIFRTKLQSVESLNFAKNGFDHSLKEFRLDQLICEVDSKTLVEVTEPVKAVSGEMIAVVGHSGSGKSSLLKSLAGLIEPRVYKANISWQETARRSSYMSQQPFLFSGSLYDNLSYGLDSEVDLDEMFDLCQRLDLTSLVKNRDELKSKMIDSIKANVSGGQLQRLTIVRGLLRKKNILLLDEAASGLDLKNEETLVKLLKETCLRDGVICIYVTHRLETLSYFDNVWQVKEHLLSKVSRQSVTFN